MNKPKGIEVELLDIFYRRDFDDDFDLTISLESFSLTETSNDLKIKEAAYYLLKLEELGFIVLGNHPKALTKAGNDENKYRNNAIMIWWENIKLTYKGRDFVENHRKTVVDKILQSILRFMKDIGNELRAKIISHIVTFLLGFAAAMIYVTFIAS